jgi:hypothetical protein
MFNNQIKDDIMRFSNVPGIEFRFDNEKQLITLCIDNDKYIDVLHIFDIKRINGNKRIYDWKNNFSLEFLNKIFSFQPEVAYSLLHFYYLLLEYNKDIENKYNVFYLHEYIYFIMNSNRINSNFFSNIKNVKNIKNQNKIESIFQSIINKNIFSTDFLKKNKSQFYDFCYSYDYFIQTFIIDSYTLNKKDKSKINKVSLESEVIKDLNRNHEKYLIDGISYEKNYIKDTNGKYDYSIFFQKIKDLVDKFMKDNKNIGQTDDDIYIKTLQCLYQVLPSFSYIFFTKNLESLDSSLQLTNNKISESFNVKYIDKNIIIYFTGVLQFNYTKGDIGTIFLNKNSDIKIDILNNKICFKHSFEWVDENIRKMFLRNMKKMKIKRLAIINFDEKNKEYNQYNYSKYLLDIQTNPPLFVLVSTQNSTTKFRNLKSVSFQHIMKEKLEEMDYSYKIKGKRIKDYDNGLKKISGKPVDRLRLYMNKNIIKNNNINNVGIDILQKKMLLNGTLCIKLRFNDNGVKKKYIFLNTNSEESVTNPTHNNIFEYIFDLLTTDNSFFQGNNRKNQNLIDLFHEGYYIYFLGNIDLSFLNNIIGNVLQSIKKNNIENKIENKIKDRFYNSLLHFIYDYFRIKHNSVINKKKNLKSKKPSIFSSKNNKIEYNKYLEQFKEEYKQKIFDFFIHTTLNGNNIFYTSLNKNDNSNIVNIL